MNKTSGIFTVSTEGLYHFSINVLRQSETNTGVQIRIDNVAACQAWSEFQESDEYGEGASCSIVRQLKPGQKVDAFLRRGSLRPSFPLENQFHGFLIR